MLVISDGINGREFNNHTYEETLAALLNEGISSLQRAVGSTSFHGRFTGLFDYASNSGGDITTPARARQWKALFTDYRTSQT